MKRIFLCMFISIACSISATAFATKYNCATAHEAPGVFFKFDDAGDNPPSRSLTLYRMSDSREVAAQFLERRRFLEGPAPEGSVIEVLSFPPGIVTGGPHAFSVRIGFADILSIPFLDPAMGQVAKVEMAGMVFAGIPVGNVTYTYCGED